MKRKHNGSTKLLKSLLFVICIKCCYSEFTPNKTGFHRFDFEQIKRDLFIQSKYSKLSDDILTENDKCLSELSEIGNGLLNFEEWAIRSNTLNLRVIAKKY